ncbi:MAG TPA: response regulator transcription factor [Saprospiraceae bacterium]|nr:response regulator transcription factor [Saprospiraceae bacterium]
MIKEKKINVVIADDHPIVVNGVKAILSNQDRFDLVGLAYSNEDLTQMLPTTKADVLLLDLNMHGKDIHKVINSLKEKYPRLKIIAYTSYNSTDLVKAILAQGVNGYLLKDTHPEEIFEAIDCVIRGEVYIGKKIKMSKRHLSSRVKDEMFFEDDFQKKLRLSRREQEILVLITQGFTSQNIGNELFISKHTVETHRKNILRKLNVNSSAELVKFAVLQGLV